MSTTTTTLTERLSDRYRAAHQCLIAVLILVTLYAAGMVLAGNFVAIRLFDVLQFGPHTWRGSTMINKPGIDYAIFCFGVLGAVLIGWMVLLACVADLAVHANASVRSKARFSMAVSVGFWFVWDTGFSLTIGQWEHAVFNLPFLSFLMGPLYVMMCNDDASEKKKEQ
jgi:hypothetical protein